MRVVPVPCLKDNFAYLVIDGDRAAVVDPGEAAPIETALAREQVKLVAIWATHHHWDHVGGVPDLVSRHGAIEVLAGETDAPKVKHVTRALADGDEIAFGATRILHNPGHTLGAISYCFAGAVFTGDTLFAAGCGRVFEGDAAMMQRSLAKLAALPPETRVYFGHEYTRANLAFAAAVEPDNRDIANRRAALPETSTPSTIADERATNPFLRVHEPAVIAAARARGASSDDPAAVFAAIRTWKDTWRAA
jgi:hydroxyacylglutathione hydrolase